MPPTMPRRWSRRAWGLWLGVGLGAAVSGCGFALRRPARLQVETVSFKHFDHHSEVAAGLRRAIERQAQVSVVEAQAQVIVERLSESREQIAVASTATGQVRELTLRSRFKFRAFKRDGLVAIPDTELVLERALSYDESLALAKEQEAELLYADMVNDIVIQVMRRLSTVRP